MANPEELAAQANADDVPAEIMRLFHLLNEENKVKTLAYMQQLAARKR